MKPDKQHIHSLDALRAGAAWLVVCLVCTHPERNGIVVPLARWVQAPGALTRILEATSYSMYLLHGVVGFSVLDVLTPRVGFGIALAVSVVAVMMVVLLLHHGFEKPALALGQRLASRLSRRPGTEVGRLSPGPGS